MPFQMPECLLGDVVLWSSAPGLEQAPALVTRLGAQGISVIVYPIDSARGFVRDGVRHKHDPDLHQLGLSEAGVWEHTERTRRAMAAQERAVKGSK